MGYGVDIDHAARRATEIEYNLTHFSGRKLPYTIWNSGEHNYNRQFDAAAYRRLHKEWGNGGSTVYEKVRRKN